MKLTHPAYRRARVVTAALKRQPAVHLLRTVFRSGYRRITTAQAGR